MFSGTNLRVYNVATVPTMRMKMLQPRNPSQQQSPVGIGSSSVQQSQSSLFQEQQEEGRKRTAWGTHIWIFLHTLSVKIKEELFPVVGAELLRLVHGIVTNLPCPQCSDHARDYMKNVNFAAIQTKQQFIDLLFQFHNSVNARKAYPLYDRADVEEHYSRAILANVYRNFETAYRDKAFNPRHIHDEYVRNRVLRQFRAWLQQHQEVFV